MRNPILFLVIFFTLTTCKAQLPPGEYTSQNKRAVSLFEDALKSYEEQKADESLETLEKVIQKDSNFIEAHLLMAEIYEQKRNPDKAISEYIKVLKINPGFSKKTYFLLAELEYQKANYADAKKDYEAFLKNTNINPNFRDVAVKKLDNCNFAIVAMKYPVPFAPKNMGDAINTMYDEYFPAVTADEKTFLYTRNNRTEKMHQQEDFLVSKKVGDMWQKATLIGSSINSPGNEGAPSLSADGQILFFVACAEIDGSYGVEDRVGYGSCDIFYAEKTGDKWSEAFNLGKAINSPFFESQPSFSADGKTLYFVSNRPGGFGETDIFVSTLNEKNYWTEPVNLGAKINTTGKEESVFIHNDGRTLYFSSNGHVGMGGLDIYVTRMDDNGKWGEPINLGYPINTIGDENSLLVGASGNIAYFASDRKGGYGGLDMYQFDLYEAARPGRITYVKGKVYDSKTKASIGAHFELIDLATAKPLIVSTANAGNGEFLVTLPVDKDYALNVSQPGYLFYSENFALKELRDNTKPFLMDVPLQIIEAGTVVELKNIFFETGKFDLKPESRAELDKLVAFLNLNSTLKIELSGHTDDVGDKKLNVTLSENRAKAVYDFLITNGIDAKRLTYKGYGDTVPKVPNDSDAHRAMNRRTEFKVTAK
jgi:outer membrane protein OmpA-like peptidoglycan-associated protein/Tol biopolymer transport system component